MLAELAARTFRDTFAADNSPEDLQLHLTRSYGIPQQTAELEDPSMTTLVAEIGGEPAGFVQIKAGPAPDCVPGPAPCEILRFYVDRAWHGRGLALLMAATVEASVRRGAGTLWLGVWERNSRAITFYQKCGFRSTGAKIFCVGNEEQKDMVMVRPL
jgi:diamine N-acetyltransferase